MNKLRAERIVNNVKNNTLDKIFVSAFDCSVVQKLHRTLAIQAGLTSRIGTSSLTDIKTLPSEILARDLLINQAIKTLNK